jgi:hypothetical protein
MYVKISGIHGFAPKEPLRGKSAPTDLTGFSEHYFSEQYLSIYPIPNTGEMTVAIKGNGYELLKLSDIEGRLIFSQVLNDGQMDQNINLNLDLSNGVYFMQAINRSGIIHGKLIVQK